MKMDLYNLKMICETLQKKKKRIEYRHSDYRKNKKWQELDAQEQLAYYYIQKLSSSNQTQIQEEQAYEQQR